MGQVLRLLPHRRNRAKWSAVRHGQFVDILLEWRTADRTSCLLQTIPLREFVQLMHPHVHFWMLIGYMRDVAKSQGARF